MAHYGCAGILPAFIEIVWKGGGTPPSPECMRVVPIADSYARPSDNFKAQAYDLFSALIANASSRKPCISIN